MGTNYPTMRGIMKKVFFHFLFAAFLAYACGCDSPAPDNNRARSVPENQIFDDEQAVRLAIRELWEAFCAQDERRLDAIIDEEYLDADGTDKRGIIKRYLAPSLICKSVDVNWEDAKIQLKGIKAVAAYRAKYSISSNGTPLLKENQSTDVFIQKNGQWRLFRGSEEESAKRESSP